MSGERFERFELKYFATRDEMDAVRAMIAPFTHVDRFAQGREGNQYTVRSIYLDTPDLRFYYEKDAGTKVRKKLRLRTYNRPCPNAYSFFEIKRKYGNAIVKERVGMPLARAIPLLSTRMAERDRAWAEIGDLGLSSASMASLERFFFYESVLLLRPVVLIVYDREPYVGNENSRIRVTFDWNVRSAIRPTMDEIFAEKGLRRLTDRRQILEVKFDGAMPAWLRPVTARLDRSHRPISKYCKGIDLWTPADRVVRKLHVGQEGTFRASSF